MALRRPPQHVPLLGLLTILALSGFAGSAFAASRAGSPTADPRIVDAVDETKSVTLAGRTHPLAAPKYDQGAVSDSFRMEHMFLQLRRSPEQEDALEQTIKDLQDPHSGKYHQWLTAEEMGTKFGPAQQDIETVTYWLSSPWTAGQYGFQEWDDDRRIGHGRQGERYISYRNP